MFFVFFLRHREKGEIHFQPFRKVKKTIHEFNPGIISLVLTVCPQPVLGMVIKILISHKSEVLASSWHDINRICLMGTFSKEGPMGLNNRNVLGGDKVSKAKYNRCKTAS